MSELCSHISKLEENKNYYKDAFEQLEQKTQLLKQLHKNEVFSLEHQVKELKQELLKDSDAVTMSTSPFSLFDSGSARLELRSNEKSSEHKL